MLVGVALKGKFVVLAVKLTMTVFASATEEPTGLAASKTFRELAEWQWATQDFLPPTAEEQEIHPSEFEMKALRYGGVGIKVGAAAICLFLAWTGFVMRAEADAYRRQSGNDRVTGT